MSTELTVVPLGIPDPVIDVPTVRPVVFGEIFVMIFLLVVADVLPVIVIGDKTPMALPLSSEKSPLQSVAMWLQLVAPVQKELPTFTVVT